MVRTMPDSNTSEMPPADAAPAAPAAPSPVTEPTAGAEPTAVAEPAAAADPVAETAAFDAFADQATKAALWSDDVKKQLPQKK
ncbi:hypothetical protein [Dongia sedimenti]|uniref:Uncharacterized protein n=1 Tax=Dongia sedimenti TaxID=3064282 RepID=A0ABU0YUP6_9PROT|nr:hypothetical protein [Rhodospirillaceae bacterium R-7]